MVIERKPNKIDMRIRDGSNEQVDSFKYLSLISVATWTAVKKQIITMAKEAINRKRNIFCGPSEKELRKNLVKSFVWSVALNAAEIWTLRRSEQK